MSKKVKKPKFTKQQTFNKILRGLLKQGKIAYDTKEDQCAYLTEDGAKCAAGQLIPAREYSKAFEGQSVAVNWFPAFNSSPIVKPTPAGRAIKKLGHNLNLVRECQSAHDSGARASVGMELSTAIGGLIEVAIEHHLKLPEGLLL